jgi:hypothetical protein
VETDHKIETEENAGRDLAQGIGKTSADDFIQRRGRTMVQISRLSQGFMHLTTVSLSTLTCMWSRFAVHYDLSVRLSRRKNR